jgi:hypothetical protein
MPFVIVRVLSAFQFGVAQRALIYVYIYV